MSGGTALRVDVLGPLRLTIDGAEADVRGPKRRAVLALLAIADGRAVTDDGLLDALWPAEIPDSGRAALHSHVSRLRGHLGPAAPRLVRLDGGYRLDLDLGLGLDELRDGLSSGLDLARATADLAAARTLLADDARAAHDLAGRALALWRGPVLAEFADVAPLAAAAIACADLQRDLTDVAIEAALAAGRLDGVVALAAAALAADPLREPALMYLMQAHARTGQAAAALDRAREYRVRLADETGLDPSPALGALERDIAAGALAPLVAHRASIPAPDPSASHPRAPENALLGRDDALADLADLLRRERLVTIVGPGGVGKTRLAQAVAAQAGAVAVLPLAPVTEPAGVPQALAAALDLRGLQGDALPACVALLAQGGGLLVVDNCEHLLDAARDAVAALLDGCPDLVVLATSRAPLGLPAESRYRLGGLALPARGRPPTEAASVAVFLDRAARVRPTFTAGPAELDRLADIVRRLDGMPLAIELAAGRLSSFSLEDLHRRLDRALDLLGDGRPSANARHRTLRATVQWSYELLPDAEQRLFRHLAAFADGVDLATAEAVAADLGLADDPGAALAHLVDASMIEVAFIDRPRYRMLETLRAFGLDRLVAAGEDGPAADRVVRWAVELTAAANVAAATDREPEADAAVRRELRNLRAAWRIARDRDALDGCVSMTVALYDLRTWRDLTELTGWAAELLTAGAIAPGHPRAAEVYASAAMDAYLVGDHAGSTTVGRAGLALPSDGADGARQLLTALAAAALSRGDWAEAISLGLQAADRGRVGSGGGIAALAAAYGGDPERGHELAQTYSAAARSRSDRAFAAYVEGEIEVVAGRPERAEELYERAIALARGAGASFITGVASVGLLAALAAGGRPADALRGYREVVDYWAHAGNWTQQWVTLRNLADLLRALDDPDPAAVLGAAADRAPDASAAPRRAAAVPPGADLSRAGALAVARDAITRHLADVAPVKG